MQKLTELQIHKLFCRQEKIKRMLSRKTVNNSHITVE